MSSFLGHAVVAAAIGVRGGSTLSGWRRGVCCLTLVLCAWVPDLDYFVPALHKGGHAGLRISHSILIASVLPLLVAVLLRLVVKGRLWRRWCGLLMLAGWSHLALDFFVGVHPLPLAWPISDAVAASSFPLLPSAGALHVDNPWLYRNAAIELAVLVPLAWLVSGWRLPNPSWMRWALLLVSFAAMAIAHALAR